MPCPDLNVSGHGIINMGKGLKMSKDEYEKLAGQLAKEGFSEEEVADIMRIIELMYAV